MRRILQTLLLVLCLAQPAFAQVESDTGPSAWDSLAERAEKTLDRGTSANRTPEALRADIADFRASFDAARDRNAARIETLRQQIAVLGPAPTDENALQEPADVTAKRNELNAQLSILLTPVQKAEAEFVRADALIGQIDRLLRERQTQELLKVSPSPLNPVHWEPALRDLSRAGRVLWREAGQSGEVFRQYRVAFMRHRRRTLLAL